VEQTRPAVVIVLGEGEQGTGMTIDADGRVLTCWHVVEGCDVPRVLVQNRYSYDCTVDTFDGETDLALLVPVGKVSTPDFVTFGSVYDVRPGDELWVIGYALALQGDASVTKGIVSAIRWIDDVAYIQTDAPLFPGNSGGPIVNNRGKVVAVAAWKIADIQIEGMQFGVAIDHALPLLEFSSSTP
jgi:S1-C subfamily serine protease